MLRTFFFLTKKGLFKHSLQQSSNHNRWISMLKNVGPKLRRFGFGHRQSRPEMAENSVTAIMRYIQNHHQHVKNIQLYTAQKYLPMLKHIPAPKKQSTQKIQLYTAQKETVYRKKLCGCLTVSHWNSSGPNSRHRPPRPAESFGGAWQQAGVNGQPIKWTSCVGKLRFYAGKTYEILWGKWLKWLIWAMG